MSVFVIGINHKTAPLDVRERFIITQDRYQEFGSLLDQGSDLYEKAILSTCNRTEIYGASQSPDQARLAILRELAKYAKLPAESFRNQFYFKENREMVGHLFSVAAGIDSMVLGETEILGQVKSAYLKAKESGFTGRMLNVLFQKSLHIGKKVRTHTEIGKGRISIASIGVDLARRIFINLSSKVILIIGSGDVAGSVCEAMAGYGANQFMIANRSQDRSQRLAEKFGGVMILYEHIDQYAPKADIVISSISASQSIVSESRVKQWMKARKDRSMFIIDLGVPRNVDAQAGNLPDVYLYNLDDLKSASVQNALLRRQAVEDCQVIVNQAADFMLNKLESFDAKWER